MFSRSRTARPLLPHPAKMVAVIVYVRRDNPIRSTLITSPAWTCASALSASPPALRVRSGGRRPHTVLSLADAAAWADFIHIRSRTNPVFRLTAHRAELYQVSCCSSPTVHQYSFGFIKPPTNIDSSLVAPKAPLSPFARSSPVGRLPRPIAGPQDASVTRETGALLRPRQSLHSCRRLPEPLLSFKEETEPISSAIRRCSAVGTFCAVTAVRHIGGGRLRAGYGYVSNASMS